MSMHKSMCNSTNTTGPASCENNVKTLGDYITKVMNEEAFLSQKKLTFDEWLSHRFPAGFENYDGNLNQCDLRSAWNAGQANK